MTSKITSFTASRVNDTTFLIVEDDSWHEKPHIYAVLHPSLPVLVLSDTGCDSPREPGLSLTRLRDFLEHAPIASNNGQPLNPGPERREYIVIFSHCHYDHIGGVEQFSHPKDSNATKSTIVASARGRKFIETNLPEHSLCKYVEMRTPDYEVNHWAADFERLSYPLKPPHMDMEASQILPASSSDLGITIIHTPGHTPDELAWYDRNERHLYVGDSFYEEGEDGAAIIFPRDGDWLDYMASMTKLLDFVRKENATIDEDSEGWVSVPKRLRVGCGHTTASVDGETILKEVIQLFEDIILGKVPVLRSEEQRGEVYDTWRNKGTKVRFSVRAPRRLCEDARKRVLPSVGEPAKGSHLPEMKVPAFLRKLPFGL